MTKHQNPYGGVQYISEDGSYEYCGEYGRVEDEEDDAQDSQRAMVARIEFREVVK